MAGAAAGCSCLASVEDPWPWPEQPECDAEADVLASLAQQALASDPFEQQALVAVAEGVADVDVAVWAEPKAYPPKAKPITKSTFFILLKFSQIYDY